MSTATSSTIDHGRQAVTSLGDKSTELENVKSKLEEYKKLADTDPLTHIWNRRAFDRRIARIYDTRQGVMFNALILADIDRFKEINDRYGHPVGDKIIQIIAEILHSNSRDDIFVARTGGEEFALVVEGGSIDATLAFADHLRASSLRRRSATARPASTTGRSRFRWASAWRAKPTGRRTSMPRPIARSTAPRSTAATR